MILKIKKSKKGNNWIYIDNINKIDVSIPADFALTQKSKLEDEGFEFNENDKYLQICGLSENCTLQGKHRVLLDVIMPVDEMILDPEEVLQQHHLDEENDRAYWGIKIIDINFSNGNDLRVACYRNNEDIYLLNNEGKTLERL